MSNRQVHVSFCNETRFGGVCLCRKGKIKGSRKCPVRCSGNADGDSEATAAFVARLVKVSDAHSIIVEIIMNHKKLLSQYAATKTLTRNRKFLLQCIQLTMHVIIDLENRTKWDF